jgi:tetratricopeptide (TPR) repeat protein
MRNFLVILMLSLTVVSFSQTKQTPEQIRQRMAEIRRTTNWDDPAAAANANAEIKKLATQLTGGQPAVSFSSSTTQKDNSTAPATVSVKSSDATKENIVAIAGRFYNRSYKTLDAVTKSKFDQDFKEAAMEEFTLQAVRRLAGTGGVLVSIGDDHNLACVYLASAVKAMPDDTLSINNFGAYLRIIDSVRTSIPVLLYANKLYGESPIVLTQLGCSYFELGSQDEAETYLKKALEYDPGFGQAHTALCELYIRQNRLEDALLELFAGVKGMGASYARASGNYAYLQQQAENAGENGNQSAKEAFWDETRNQMNPPEPLAPLERSVERIKMPNFPNCQKVEDWTEGGGYAAAVQSYNKFAGMLKGFSEKLLQIHKEPPSIPPNAVLRDYASERFALDCITEYFARESHDESADFTEITETIREEINKESEAYFQKKEVYTNEFLSCAKGCGTDAYCLDECHRVYCTKECPSANIFNKQLQGHWEDYLDAFKQTVEKQKELLDDLYEFTAQWYSRIESPYWSRIYAYEIQRVALSVIANAYAAYPMPFMWPAHNDCGTDCSVYANPYPMPADEVEEQDPKENNCPPDKKLNIGLAICSIALDCESAEFGCAEGMAFSIKRNFKNKSTTSFIGVGAEASLGFAKAEATAGFTMTRYDNGDLDVGVKAEASATKGIGPASAGKNYEVNVTVMEGLKTENKDVIGIGF